jgi:NAD(P)H dehydrogenase (quinone)
MASKDTLVITGASGQLGRLVAQLLLRQKHAGRLILVSRQPDKLQDLAARGAELRFGDFDDTGSLEKAFAGGDKLLLISTTDLGKRVQQHTAALAVAAAVSVRHVVYTSMLSPDPRNPAVITASHLATELAIHEFPLESTILRNSLYSDYQVPEALRAAETGRFVHNRGDGRIAYVAREDCAAVAAAVMGGSGHAGKVYEVTGPKAWSPLELAELYAEFSGKAVVNVPLGDTAFIDTMLAAGGDGHARYGAELVASFGRAIREGWFEACTDTVKVLTGRPPMALGDLLKAALLPK